MPSAENEHTAVPAPFTSREIMRLIASVDGLNASIDGLRKEMSETYVRKDVYESDRKLDAAQGTILGDRVSRQEGNWSKVAWFIGLTVAGALLTLVLAQNGVLPA